MEFLTESIQPAEARVITESSSDGKTMWLSGVCMQSAIRNRNGRTYSTNEMAEQVARASVRIKETNGIFGELDHPQTLQINSDRISHVIREMWMNGTDAYGKAELLNTPMGLIAQELVKSGVKMGVSSRAAGNVDESGNVSGFQFQTYDIVCTPSASGAVPSVMYESLDTTQGRRIITLAEQLREDPAAQKYFVKEITSFLNQNLFAKR